MSSTSSLTYAGTSLSRLPGDHGSYLVNDGAAAVELAGKAPSVAVDIETGSANSDRRWNITAVTVGTAQVAVVMDPVTCRAAIIDALAVATRLVFHNAAYDVPILIAAGLMAADDVDHVDDTLVTARMCWPEQIIRNDLGSVADRVLGTGYSDGKRALEQGFKALTNLSKAAMFDSLGMDSPAFVAYAAFDVITTARVHEVLVRTLVDRLGAAPVPTGDFVALQLREQRINRMMVRQSARGLTVDDHALAGVVDELRGDASAARHALSQSGLDPAATVSVLRRDVVDRLASAGLLPAGWPRLKNGLPTTDKHWLARVDHPLVVELMRVASAERFVDDYATKVDGLARGGRLHPQVNVLAAVTGRMSYASPPLQQFPPKVRRILRAEAPIVSLDWSSIEPVVVANLAGDDAVLHSYEAGHDLYQPLADSIGCARAVAKTVLLATLYGQGISSLALRLGVVEDTARRLRDDLLATMPKVTLMLQRVSDFGDARGWIRTVSGRPLPLPASFRRDDQFAGYKGINYLVQGSAYDLLAEALISIEDAGLAQALFVVVHDEIVVAADAADDVARIMTTPPPCLLNAARIAGRTGLPVLRVGRSDLGHNWNEKA